MFEDELFDKIKNTIEDRTIKILDGEYSIYGHKVVLIINGSRYDISSRIPENIWNLGGEYKSPEDKWKITIEVNKQATLFIRNFDPNININESIFAG